MFSSDVGMPTSNQTDMYATFQEQMDMKCTRECLKKQENILHYTNSSIIKLNTT